MINDRIQCLSRLYKQEQNPTCTVPIEVNLQGDGSYYNKDILDGMMLSLKETTNTSCAGFFLKVCISKVQIKLQPLM